MYIANFNTNSNTNTIITEENMALLDCHFETKDWRQCTEQMKAFQECWQNYRNNDRTGTKDA